VLVKVSLDHVSKAFGAVKALQDVSVGIKEGELFLMVAHGAIIINASRLRGMLEVHLNS
jgi:ABC-type uncharacterized transport system ATPase subunit